jgi:MFS family permease
MIALEISSFIFATLVPLVSERIGRKSTILLGYLVVVLSTCALAFTYFIDQANNYFWISIACRFMQGVGD